MKAMVVRERKPAREHPLEPADLPLPEPGPGEIRIRVAACGVCHTDLHIAEGDLPLKHSPLTPGHQIVGSVDLCGPGVTEHTPGARVGVTWLASTCGTCRFCVSGRENLCEQARFTGYDRNGGFAEYTIADASFAFPLPPDVSDIQTAPLLCAGVIGYRSLRLSGIEPGGRLGLFGFGASAHVAIQVARHRDCEVFVFTRSGEHREHARELGAVWTGSSKDDPPRPLDAAITFAPAGEIVPDALRVLDRGGKLAINAVHLTDIPPLSYDLVYHERSVASVANLTRTDARELLALAADIPIETDVEVFPLDGANDALIRLKESRIRGAAVLTVPQ